MTHSLEHKKNPGSLIILNGTSSSGKSATLQAFTKKNPHFKTFKVDDFFPTELKEKALQLGWKKNTDIDPWSYLIDYVENKTAKPCFGTEVRAHLFNGISTMFVKVKEQLSQGNNIILDTVFEFDGEYEKCMTYFKNFNCYKVLIYCPLDELIKRVQKRNTSGNKDEIRTSFQSFEQFPAIYKIKDDPNEQFVDYCSTQSIAQALDIAMSELINAEIPTKYIKRIYHFQQHFIKLFKLHTQEKIKIAARHHYDLIINSALFTPDELAQKIIENWNKKTHNPLPQITEK